MICLIKIKGVLHLDWNTNLYDQQHSFVSKYGKNLIELLEPTAGEKILDLGCGTGDLAQQLDELRVDVIGVDRSEKMIDQAKTKYPSIEFSVQDARSLEFQQEFDAIFSNATLHWIKPPSQALQCLYNSLKKGGRFVAEFGGKGNVQTITNAIIQQIEEAGFEFQAEHNPWFFPSISEYSTLMETVGFRVTYAQHFDRPTKLEGENGLKNWIHMFANQLFEGIPVDKKAEMITKVEMQLKELLFKDDHWIADYKRIRVVGVKE